MLVSDLSGQEAIGSNSHGEITSHVLISPLFAPPSSVPRHQEQPKTKKKRSQPGNPDPSAEVIALSPRTLLATNRFVCEICNKGFQRDQNLQLHRRGHNLPWKLRQRSLSAKGDGAAARKRVYVCPEPTCVHHDPARALGDLTGIKKHFSRKHGEKRWQCERCGKQYAVQSDWKAHVKSCGTREYRCDCGILFSRKDSLTTHRVFCDALAEETARLLAATDTIMTTNNSSNNSSLLSLSDPPTALLPASQLSPCLDQLPIAADAASASPVANTVNFGVLDGAEDPVALHGTAGPRGLTMTRDFLGVEAGEPELQLPLSAAGRPGCSSTTASSGGCATGLTMQYFGRLRPANETWSNL